MFLSYNFSTPQVFIHLWDCAFLVKQYKSQKHKIQIVEWYIPLDGALNFACTCTKVTPWMHVRKQAKPNVNELCYSVKPVCNYSILWIPMVIEKTIITFCYSKLTQLTNTLSNFIIKVLSEEAVVSIVKSVMIEFTS